MLLWTDRSVQDTKRIWNRNLQTEITVSFCAFYTSTSPLKRNFYTLLFYSFFKVEFDINHFVLGEHWER